MAGRAAQARRHNGESRPQRPQPRQGHLETGSVFPQRKTRRVPVRHCPQRAHPDQPRRRDTLHAQVGGVDVQHNNIVKNQHHELPQNSFRS